MQLMDIEIEPTVDVPLVKWDDGTIRVKDSRVLIELVIWAFQRGDTPEHIVQSYTSLKLPYVYIILGYYLTHREELDRYVAWVEAKSERQWAEWDKRYPPDPNLKAKLQARLDKQQ
jgi:uncharacterized protein (DUF433 family)